ncbi:MAG: hypothetical protein J1F67_07825 [Muribaculaceae bacterium]|nr:hypothetical protein [Muribaculaceae bacterium]
MKLTKHLFGVALTALTAGAFVSCTNDFKYTPNSGKGDLSVLSPVTSPDVIVWSGDQTFGNSFDGTRSTGYASDITANSYVPKTRAIPEGYDNGNEIIAWKDLGDNIVKTVDGDDGRKVINEHEQAYIDDRLPEEHGNLLNVDFNFLFFAASPDEDLVFKIYPVFGQSGSPHDIGMFYYDDQGTIQIIEEYVWSALRFGDWGQKYWQTSATGREIRVKAGYKFGFYWENDVHYYPTDDPSNPGNTMQKTRAFSSSTENQESYITVNWVAQLDQKTKIRAVLFDNSDDENNPTKRTYLGIEDSTDFDYQDVVFTTDKILVTVEPDEVMPNIPGEGDSKCDRCKHPHHGPNDNDEVGTCDQCTKPGDGCYKEPEGTDPTPTPGDKVCDNCGHDHPGPSDDCPECAEGGPADGYHDPCVPDDSESSDPTKKPVGNEVEINLSLLDIHTLPNGSQKYDVADLVSKLSMHVRYPHDVEVIIPVPQSIYCDQDDLYILKDHYVNEEGEPNWVYGGEKNEITYVIGGYVKDENGNITEQNKNVSWTVKLGVEFVPAGALDKLTNQEKIVKDKDNKDIVAGGYIRVYTEGICKELIDFLKDYYGDGINFEVYNYYNRGTQYTTGKYAEISYETLQYNYLSHSFVNFDWNEAGTKILPDYYINAFNKVNLLPVKGDCYNWILGDSRANIDGVYLQNGGVISGSNTEVTWGDNTQRAEFANPYQGEHYNGSDLNWIYTNKDVGGVDSDDMPTDTQWPFIESPWQFYKFGDVTTWNWAPASSD